MTRVTSSLRRPNAVVPRRCFPSLEDPDKTGPRDLPDIGLGASIRPGAAPVPFGAPPDSSLDRRLSVETPFEVAIMADENMLAQMATKAGFIAALDQSGGSTPAALRLYGIPDDAYAGDEEMYRLMH